MGDIKLPWPYVGTSEPSATAVPNVPTPEGAELGRHMARFADQEAEKHTDVRERCDDCAFRLGTIPNQCGATLMDATKCLFEGEPFWCHKGQREGEPRVLCAGYELLRRER